jgi:hypothetical protein
MKRMSVTRDVNLGTLVPVMLWLLGMSVGGLLWGSALTAEVGAMREWQVRQDSRLSAIEVQQDVTSAQNARMEAVLEVIRSRVDENNQLLIEELRREQRNGP